MAADQRAGNDIFIPVTPSPLHTAIMSEYSSELAHILFHIFSLAVFASHRGPLPSPTTLYPAHTEKVKHA